MAKKSKRMGEFEDLPEPCIATILSHTTPIDTCRLSLVSKIFHSASNSNAVWNQFLPYDSNLINSIISRFPSLANLPSKKALFRAISDRHIIIDDGKKSFQLDKKSGKICYMLSARSLTIDCESSASRRKKWIAVPNSRFPKVGRLSLVSRLEIHGMINTLSLSPNTEYAAYLVFMMSGAHGFEKEPAKLSVGVEGGPCITKSVCLDRNVELHHTHTHVHSHTHTPVRRGSLRYCKCLGVKRKKLPKRIARLQRPFVRNDGWSEIEMGKFFNSSLQDKEVRMSVIQEKSGVSIRHFFLEGIEVRPTDN
ncbi:hypothetical protein P8452_08898 [Trifolium repens]|nr:hypothetical protein P8452_08898 [Trifolium repens]